MTYRFPLDQNASAPVQSVNGETGTVVLEAADVGAVPEAGASTLTGINSAAFGSGHNQSGVASLAAGQDHTQAGAYSYTWGLSNTAAYQFVSVGGRQGAARCSGSQTIGLPQRASLGDRQFFDAGLYAVTTGTTGKYMSQPGGIGAIEIVDGRTYALTALLSAHRTDAAESAGYWVTAVAQKRGGTHSILSSDVTVLHEDDANWTVVVNAVNANGTDAITLYVNGAAGKTIHWVAKVSVAEAG